MFALIRGQGTFLRDRYAHTFLRDRYAHTFLRDRYAHTFLRNRYAHTSSVSKRHQSPPWMKHSLCGLNE